MLLLNWIGILMLIVAIVLFFWYVSQNAGSVKEAIYVVLAVFGITLFIVAGVILSLYKG